MHARLCSDSALVLHRVGRGALARWLVRRKRAHEAKLHWLRRKIAARTIARMHQRFLCAQKAAVHRQESATTIQSAFRGYMTRRVLLAMQQVLNEKETQRRAAAAVIMQRAFRGMCGRMRAVSVREQRAQVVAAVAMQRLRRGR